MFFVLACMLCHLNPFPVVELKERAKAERWEKR